MSVSSLRISADVSEALNTVENSLQWVIDYPGFSGLGFELIIDENSDEYPWNYGNYSGQAHSPLQWASKTSIIANNIVDSYEPNAFEYYVIYSGVGLFGTFIKRFSQNS